jgi:uncharacterized membrane protein
MIPRDRIEALTDGIFGFAMTLLVTSLVIPDALTLATNADLIDVLANLRSSLFAYAISFVVLGVRWAGQAGTKGVPDEVGGGYLWAVLVHLFFITTMPFSTMVIGRFGDLPAAVWVYSANMAFAAAAALVMSFVAEHYTGQKPEHTGRIDLLVLIATAVLSVVISFFEPRYATLAYLLNFAKPLAERMLPQHWRDRLH